MISRSYPAVLGTIAAGLVLLAWWAASEAARLSVALAEFSFDVTEQPLVEDQMRALNELNLRAWTMQQVPQWAVLGACIAGVAALVLLVLRSRAQAGSASATASREASAAFSRS